MKGYMMRDRAILANPGTARDPLMNHHKILEVTARTDVNLKLLASGHRIGPDRDLWPNVDFTLESCGFMNESRIIERDRFANSVLLIHNADPY
jgi:hypothetical protein